MRKTTTRRISLANKEQTLKILGRNDKLSHLLEKEFDIVVIGRGEDIALKGKPAQVSKAKKFIDKILSLSENKEDITEDDILFAMQKTNKDKAGNLEEIIQDRIEIPTERKHIVPKNPAQKRYIESIKENEIVFSIGPAGTGKTYLAMAMAVHYLANNRTGRVILVRPAVEAGEKLGFLPGDLQEKINPYLRPLYDALYEMLETEKLHQYLQRNIIEIAPLAYMRGRTFNDAFIVLDEAQNSTPEQMKMFLTRLGFDSKVIVTGDITQIDLPGGTASGLVEVQHILKGIKGIDFAYFTGKDVVRHKLVQDIIRAYEKQKNKKTS
ncbi:MAG: PhoH family protein [Candidatus Omnitrophica bacterium]|nr:PhoH family protein [Candidatus Omnitrophota bacterium]MBU1047601.1 PhoH family protein [Candidatus Omnitrophota bacterium]MBU1631491.1 PhoH family protein [Candidatus Omnitrophota bacterium]MBU1888963.1 PhoH family protein [Candidatus Omnitrophota bacterium]